MDMRCLTHQQNQADPSFVRKWAGGRLDITISTLKLTLT